MTAYITELLVDGEWQNITPDVRDSAPIILERGRRDWATDTDPSTCSLRLNNGPSKVAAGVQGRYSTLNPRSDLFGKIGRNTPIRVRKDTPRDAFLALPGLEDSYASTPDAAALDITGDIDVRIDVEPVTWRPDSGFGLARKYLTTGDQRSWAFYLNNDGTLHLRWSPDGTLASFIFANSTTAVPETSGRLALRATLDVNNGAAGHTVRFYTSDTIDGSWTLLGSAVVTAGVTSIHSGTADLEVARVNPFGVSIDPYRGSVYAFALLSGIAGTEVANPDFTAHEPDTRTFTDDAGRTWTLHDSAVLADTSIRFTGEAKSWPLQWDLSGADRWVRLTAAGITRRLQRGSKPLKSSLFRDLSIKDDVVAYWPLEDAKGSTRFNAGRPDDTSFLAPHHPAEVTFAADDETFFASSPLPTVGATSIGGAVPSFAAANDQRIVFLISIPADVTWATEKIIARVYTSGWIKRWDISKSSGDNTRIRAYDADGTSYADAAFALPFFGVPCALSLWLQQDGANIDWQIAYFPLDGTTALAGTGTIVGHTFARMTRVLLGTTDDMEGSTFGHAFILNDDVQSIWDTIRNSMVGWSGETGLDRLVRLAGDEGLPAVRSIGANDGDTMGPQRPLDLMTLFREVPRADLGLLTDRPDALGLQYRSRSDLYSQEPVLVLDYSSGVIAEPFVPVEDDQAIVNEVTVERVRGSSFTAADTTGPLSSLDPPAGVGKYDVSQEINIDADGRLRNQAFWRLHLGTIDEPRFPELTLNLRNARAAALEDEILSVTEGDIIRITNPPVWLAGGPYDLLVEGIREEKTAVTHEISFSASPGSAWNVGVFDEDEGPGEARYSSDGSTLAAGAALLLNGVSPGRASTPDVASLDIVGDLDLRVHAALDDWTPAAASALITKSTTAGNQISWRFNVLSTGVLRFVWSADGSATLTADSTVAPTVDNGAPLWVRATIDVNNGAAGRTVTFYTSTDGETWTMLGTAVTTAGVTSIFSGTAPVVVGSREVGTADRLAGRVFSAEVRSGIGGTIVASPDFGVQLDGTTSFFDSTGKTWTVASPAVIDNAVIVVDTPTGPKWGDADAPYDLLVGGERMTVTAVTGAGTAQAFTVTRSVNGVVKIHAAGTEVALFKPAIYAL